MDLEDLIKKINEKEPRKEECLGTPLHTPMYEDNSCVWILLLLLLLLDFPKKEEKAPVIEIYIGGDE